MNVDTLRETGLKPGTADAASAAEAPVCLEFDGGRIEPSRNLVRLDGEAISLEPRTMEVLAYLATHSGHVVSKAELLANVWEGRWVAGDALSVYIYELRKALGDDARSPRFVETVRKRGYRWMPPVRLESLPLMVSEVDDTSRDVAEQDRGELTGLSASTVARPARERSGETRRYVSLIAIVVLTTGLFAWAFRTPDFVTAEMPDSRLARPADASTDAQLALTELCRGDEYFRGRSPGDLLRAELAYLRATELDPALANAWGGLATTYAMMAEYPMRDRFELYHQARRAAERSFELDPDAPVAHVAMAMVRLVTDWDRVEARREIALAVDTGSNMSLVWEIRGWVESADGDYEDAIASLRRSIELDPHSGYLHAVLGFINGLAGDKSEMLLTFDRAIDLDPGNYLVYWYGWVIHWTSGDYDEAVPWLLEAIRLRGRTDLVETLERTYHDDGFSSLLTYYEGIIPEHANLMERARIALYFGQRDQALDLLEEAAAERDSALTWLASYPDLRALRDEPRYRELVEQVGGRV